MNHFYHIDFDQIKLNRDSFTALIFHRIQQNIIKGDDSSFAVVAEVCGVPFGPAASAIGYGTAVGGFINSSRSSNVTLYSFHLYYILLLFGCCCCCCCVFGRRRRTSYNMRSASFLSYIEKKISFAWMMLYIWYLILYTLYFLKRQKIKNSLGGSRTIRILPTRPARS